MNKINFNELTLDNIGQWPTLAKYLLLIILSLALIAIGYWVLVKPNLEEYAALQTQEAALKPTFEVKQQQAANLQAYKNQ